MLGCYRDPTYPNEKPFHTLAELPNPFELCSCAPNSPLTVVTDRAPLATCPHPPSPVSHAPSIADSKMSSQNERDSERADSVRADSAGAPSPPSPLLAAEATGCVRILAPFLARL